MKISFPQITRHDGLVRISAMVRFEDCDQPEKEVYIETETSFAADLAENPHAFLVGCLIPAMHFGERRIRMEAGVCPGLKEGLQTVMALVAHWSRGKYAPLSIDMQAGSAGQWDGRKRRAGLFLSGGIDSLAALRLNRLAYPADHPGAVKICLMVHGFDIGGVVARGAKLHVFDRARDAMQPVARDAGVSLIPVYTNIRHLCDERDLWLNYFFGAVLASVAHAFAPRLHMVWIASSYDIPNLVPCGSHPMIDPEYSSFDMAIRHRDAAVSRLDKLRLISEWDAAFHHFRVCLANVPDRLNCGVCEKCVRTRLELLAIDRLDQTRAFVENDVQPGDLDGFRITIRHRDVFYRELIGPLRRRGRMDLVQTIERKLQE